MYGHQAVLARLTALLERDRLAHALLFTGPAGIGKVLAARVFAAQVFCTSSGPVPCGECHGCRQVAAGTHPDLVIVAPIAGKKEIGVDVVRRLKHTIQLHAVSGRRKVAIIDEADRLSIAAQNALLKTLEEPPPGSVIILVTASPGALLPTVRSRCQRIVFRPLDQDAVAAVLQDSGGLDVEQARALAAHADGSPGRALRLRELIESEESELWERILAELNPSRYVSVVSFSKALGRGEQTVESRLEWLLSWYRDAAARATNGPALAVTPAARGGEIVLEALQLLRRRNPNRPLLAEALGLRLARAVGNSPLCKRGVRGDFPSATTSAKGEIPPSPPSSKGGA